MLGTDAVAGFFCGGEIGPVGGKAFLHGFTATLAVFPQPSGPGEQVGSEAKSSRET
jgi:small ligand-binding sensory domain FIST